MNFVLYLMQIGFFVVYFTELGLNEETATSLIFAINLVIVVGVFLCLTLSFILYASVLAYYFARSMVKREKLKKYLLRVCIPTFLFLSFFLRRCRSYFFYCKGDDFDGVSIDLLFHPDGVANLLAGGGQRWSSAGRILCGANLLRTGYDTCVCAHIHRAELS